MEAESPCCCNHAVGIMYTVGLVSGSPLIELGA